MQRLLFLTFLCALSVFEVLLGGAVSKSWASPPETQSFNKAAPHFPWSFPKDHGAHSNFQSEWWYYTGQLYGPGKERFKDAADFGFQLTFFRRAQREGDVLQQGYLAHAVVTDVVQQRCYFASRQADATLGVGSIANDWLRANLGDWSAEEVASKHLLRFSVPSVPNWLVRLIANPEAPPVLQGLGGFSAKGGCPTCASMYYSLPAMTVEGEVQSNSGTIPVRGVSWMDHEFMTNSLTENQQGWDWLGLMFKDGARLMVFRIRDTAGGLSFLSGGLYRNGVYRALSSADLSLTPLDTWSSPESKVGYPVAWRIEVPSESIDVTVRARVPSCELRSEPASSSKSGTSSGDSSAPVYWEGPVASSDEGVIGYLEMTGYAGKVRL
jgi:predicted secreted hydrolase